VCRDVRCDNFGFFFDCKSRIDEVVTREICADGVVRRTIPIEPRANRALFPCDENIRRVVGFYIEYFFADDEELTVIIDVKHTPFNRFFAIGGVGVLFVVTEGNGIANFMTNIIPTYTMTLICLAGFTLCLFVNAHQRRLITIGGFSTIIVR
jgi:hypothetical protein